MICERLKFDIICAPVYLDENYTTRVVTSIKNIGLLCPLYNEEKKEGKLLDENIKTILFVSQLTNHYDIILQKCERCALQIAAEEGNILKVKSLLTDIKVEPALNPSHKLNQNIHKTSVILQLIIKCERFKFGDCKYATTNWACRYGDLEVLKLILNQSSYHLWDTNYIKLAIEYQHLKIVEYLLTCNNLSISSINEWIDKANKFEDKTILNLLLKYKS